MGTAHSTKSKTSVPILTPFRLHVNNFYKQELSAGKDLVKSGKCKKLTRKQKCKDGYRLYFGEEKMDNCSSYRTLMKLRFKRCTRKAT